MSKATIVVLIGTITITAQVLLVLWSEKFILPNLAPSPGWETPLSWVLLGAGLVTVVAVVGPSHERIWLVGLLFLIVTFFGTFFIGQFVLSFLEYQRDYTQVVPHSSPSLGLPDINDD